MCTGDSGYRPSQLVELFHNAPRFKSNWVWGPSTDFNHTLGYAQSIVVWACVPLALFTCFGLVLAILAWCIYCNRDSKPFSRQVMRMCAVGLLFVTTICLVGIGTSVWADVSLDGRIKSLLKEVQNISNLAARIINESSGFDGGGTVTALKFLWEVIYDSGNQTSALTAAELLINETEELMSAFSDINETMQFFNLKFVKDTVNGVEIVRHWTVMVNMVLCVLLVPLVLFALVCIRKPCSIMALLGLLTIVLFSLVTLGGCLATLMVTSDICHDPDGVIKNYTPLSIADLVNYYLSCDGTCENPFTKNLVLMSENKTRQVVSYISEHIQDECSLAALGIIASNLITSVGIVQNISELINCTNVHMHYTSMQTILCSNAMIYAFTEFSLITVVTMCGIALFTCGCIKVLLRTHKKGLVMFGSSLVAAYKALDKQ